MERAILTAAIVLIGAGISTPSFGQEARVEALNKAWELIVEHRYKKVIELAEPYHDPSDEYSSVVLGLAYMRIGDCDTALDRISNVAQEYDSKINKLESRNQNDDEDKKFIEQARYLYQNMNLVIGNCYNELKEWHDSALRLEKYLDLKGEDIDVLPIIAESYSRASDNDLEKAIAYFSKYAEEGEKDSKVYEGVLFSLASLHAKKGDFGEAENYALRLLRNSSNPSVWYRQMKKKKELIPVLSREKVYEEIGRLR